MAPTEKRIDNACGGICKINTKRQCPKCKRTEFDSGKWLRDNGLVKSCMTPRERIKHMCRWMVYMPDSEEEHF